MGEKTAIDWCDHSWNPWQGCKKVSPGCAKCYMFRDKVRFGQDPEEVKRSKPSTFNLPLRWKEPARVFVCSWSDFFIEEAAPWRDEAWEIMKKCSHLTFLLLTKRPNNILGEFPVDGWPENVWLGVTAENQTQWDYRVSRLKLFTNVPVRFVSVEPMLGPIDITCGRQWVDWVICGGESGPGARPMSETWAWSLMMQCRESRIPFFMKQMSGVTKAQRAAIPNNLWSREFPVETRRGPRPI